jgi:hypothetical protein
MLGNDEDIALVVLRLDNFDKKLPLDPLKLILLFNSSKNGGSSRFQSHKGSVLLMEIGANLWTIYRVLGTIS